MDSDKKTIERITFFLAGLLLLSAIIAALLDYLRSFVFIAPGAFWLDLLDFLRRIWPIWKLLATIVSMLALFGVVHNLRKLRAIDLEEQKIYETLPTSAVSDEEKVIEPRNEKWERVISYAHSDNVSDWRLAIIEADVMLEDMLHALGYKGESVGEILKSVDKNEFATIEDAWEAHKVRNAIAHSGGDFPLNERETKRVVALFEKVFKEFGVI